jgi:hypothetical protein
MLHPTCNYVDIYGNGERRELDLFEKGVAVDICCTNMLLRMCRLERSCNHGGNECPCILILALSTNVFVISILQLQQRNTGVN